MRKIFLLTLILILLSACTSSAVRDPNGLNKMFDELNADDPSKYESYTDYLEVPLHNSLFQRAVKSGELGGWIQDFINACKGSDKDTGDLCSCSKSKANDKPATEWFFDKMYSAELTKKMVEANAKGDMNLTNQLMEKFKMESLTYKIAKVCE